MLGKIFNVNLLWITPSRFGRVPSVCKCDIGVRFQVRSENNLKIEVGVRFLVGSENPDLKLRQGFDSWSSQKTET